MDDVQGIKVAVRVRPFNQRERNASSGCVVSMNGNCTTLTHPESKEQKTFVFDFSYWSHSEYEEDVDGVNVPTSERYADQRRVFQELGQGVLDNAWDGYNATLFAYGQTGAGKSYSVIGYGANKGIVPITCEELFARTQSLSLDGDKSFQISYSMLEIYNENVRDLLVGAGDHLDHRHRKQSAPGARQRPLKVRQNPKNGFYVEGLKVVPVESYGQIKSLMDQGNLNRTTAATNLNATSSRSHMLIRLVFKQIFLNDTGESTTKSSEINLVDLAGSERSKTAGTSGDRLKEGSAINQSLLTLGNVISALADNALKKNSKSPVPYRDSELTKLLQSSLGGNSKTVMIAALSPAAINHDESLSTLRFADRVKKIKNHAVVNESPTDRLIRELKEENQRLMNQLQRAASMGVPETLSFDVEGVDAQRMLEENQRQMEEMEKSWQQRLDEAKRDWEKKQEEIHKIEENDAAALCNVHPYIRNVNEDAQLSGMIREVIKPGDQILGKGGGDVAISILLRGLGVLQQHAFIRNTGESVSIRPFSTQAKISINGVIITDGETLDHLDRIKLGSNNLFIFVGFPHQRDSKVDETKFSEFDYDFLQSELARGSELLFQRNDSNSLRDVTFMNFLQLMPQVGEVNSMSEELAKKHHNANVKFEPLIKNLASYDDTGNEKAKEVLVKMTNLKTNQVWVWSKAKFINRKYLIEELYNQMICEGKEMTLEKKSDPFWDPPEDIFLGSSHAWLQPLAYQVEVDDQLEIHGHHGDEAALAQVQIHPCTAEGKLLGEEATVLEPTELLGARVDFMFQIRQVVGVRWVQADKKNRGFYFAFKFFDLPKLFKSKTIWGKSSAKLGFKKQFTIKVVNDDFLDYLQTHALVLEVWGTQSGGDVRDVDSPSGDDHLPEIEAPARIQTSQIEAPATLKASQESLNSTGRSGFLENSLSRAYSRQNSDRLMLLKSAGGQSMNFTMEGVLVDLEKERDNVQAERDELKRIVRLLEGKVQTLESENEALRVEKDELMITKSAALAEESRVDSTSTIKMEDVAALTHATPATQSHPTPATKPSSDESRNNGLNTAEAASETANASAPAAASAAAAVADEPLEPSAASASAMPDEPLEPLAASAMPDEPLVPSAVVESEEISQKSDRSTIDSIARQSVVKAFKRFFTEMKSVEKELDEIQGLMGGGGGKRAETKLKDRVEASGVTDGLTDGLTHAGEMASFPEEPASGIDNAVLTKLKETRGKLSSNLAKFKNKMKLTLKTRKDD